MIPGLISARKKKVRQFAEYLKEEEKASATVKKYIHDVKTFYKWIGDDIPTKKQVLKYKGYLAETFKATSANSMLISLNRYFEFSGRQDLHVKGFRVQTKTFVSTENELTKEEYCRLIEAAEGNIRLKLVIETICATGIRVSELSYITAEAIRSGKAKVKCKGKIRVIMIPEKLVKNLAAYMHEYGIKSGSIFITRGGNPLDRSNIWADMKALCEKAKVSRSKVYPHNLRHLFARVFYSIEKDIVRLADILGHSCIETTRIYIRSCGNEHIRQLEKMALVL